MTNVALAVNSRLSRAQDQLHIHIGCIFPAARRVIGSIAAELSDTGWTRVNLGAHGLKVWARSDGRDGFVALAWLDDAAMPSRSLAAEEFLDPHCSH
jgi:CDP-diacylglycerol pyrophosphatase